jgi:hypothetical protein
LKRNQKYKIQNKTLKPSLQKTRNIRNFPKKIYENLLLDIGLREETENTMTLLVVDRMSCLKKKTFLFVP